MHCSDHHTNIANVLVLTSSMFNHDCYHQRISCHSHAVVYLLHPLGRAHPHPPLRSLFNLNRLQCSTLKVLGLLNSSNITRQHFRLISIHKSPTKGPKISMILSLYLRISQTFRRQVISFIVLTNFQQLLLCLYQLYVGFARKKDQDRNS